MHNAFNGMAFRTFDLNLSYSNLTRVVVKSSELYTIPSIAAVKLSVPLTMTPFFAWNERLTHFGVQALLKFDVQLTRFSCNLAASALDMRFHPLSYLAVSFKGNVGRSIS